MALLAVGFLLLLMVALFGGLRRMTRPMTQPDRGGARIEAGDYTVQVPESGPRDLRSVARAFNQMSARLKATDEQRRGFLAELAHEFRTPMTVIRGQTEAIGTASIRGMRHTSDRSSTPRKRWTGWWKTFRTLVLTDAGSLVLHKEPTDLGALAAYTVDSFRTQAEAAHVSLSSEIAATLDPVDLDPPRIRGVIGNLLSNAIRHTPPGGSVVVGRQARGRRGGRHRDRLRRRHPA